MAPERSCRETTADGTPCGAPPNVVDPDTGFCPAHGPDGRERMAEMARKGGEAAARRRADRGMGPDDLPPLVDHEAAETWCDVVGRAVADGTLGHNQGRTILRAVKEWRQSRDAGAQSDRLDALMDALAEWRQTGDPEPVLELVDGGAEP